MATRFPVLALCFAIASTSTTTSAIDCTFSSSYPRQYIAYKADKDLVIDGQLTDAEWLEVGFSEDFVDISTNTTPFKRTNIKIRYTDDFLLIGGLLQENDVFANITSTCHCNTSNTTQVIYQDNDFEVFVDADGSTHFYKETELNVLNATWDLLLNKPYDDGGGENSSRVFGPDGFDMQPPLHCRTYTDGRVNIPNSGATYWSVELALPFSKLVYNTSATIPPSPGDIWRINFSRVEWAVQVITNATTGQQVYWKEPSCQSCPVPGTNTEDNWVWSPQGSIAMHLPERWGMLQFADSTVNATAPIVNPEWPVRSVAMALYYAQHAYAAANNNTFTDDIEALFWYTPDPHVLDGTCTSLPAITLSNNGANFNASLWAGDGEAMYATIQDDRYLRVYHQ